ncbi:hypothetical protein KY290_008197 [Solanum tuberosum]|uniref:Integrase core domain containing protein n=1 Tax=Solanum tuberosum TaxID=4113 RepID=A0ABQ7W7R2_SOLTU|nr:hypothetical protein KY290_008197 [Solanum tuberosum]
MQQQQLTSGAVQEAIHFQLGKRKSNQTVLPGQWRFYRPHPKKPMVEGARKIPGRPRLIYDQSQQATVLQVPHVATHAPPHEAST